jgi:type I restriction enzyme S subunit
MTLGELEQTHALIMRNGFPCGNNNELGNGIPQLRPMNVDNSGEIDLQSVKCIEISRDVSGYFLQLEDVIFNNTNSRGLVGKTALWSGELQQCVLSNHMTFVRILQDGVVVPQFLARYLHFLWLHGYFEKIRRQHVNQASISLERLRDVEVPLPPLPEQRAIARALRAVQQAKEARRREAALERERKAALMEHLFTHGTRGEPTKETDIGEMPASWQVIIFNEVVQIQQGQVDPKKEPYSEMIHVGPDNIEQGTGRLLSCKTAKELQLISGKYLFTETAVLYSKIRPHLRKATLPTFSGLCSADMYPCRPRSNRLVREFLFYFLLSERFTANAVACQARTGIPKINRTQLGSILLPLPDPSEQSIIARCLQSCDSKIECLEREALFLDELFRALLEELMTGRLSAVPLIEATREPLKNETQA